MIQLLKYELLPSGWIRKLLTAGLILCLVLNSSLRLTACSIVPPDTLPTLERVKLLVPRGFYVLTEEGARAALKAKVDADTYFQLLSESDKALLKANSQLVILQLQNGQLKEAGQVNAEAIRGLKGKLFWANFFKWVSVGGNMLLVGKLVRIF